MSTLDIASLRAEYTKRSLRKEDVDGSPIRQFNKWFDEAMKAKVMEPNAMSLATADSNGRPSVRIVLLKGVEHGKFKFYTNYASAKGQQIDVNPAVCLNFFWPELERQVRIEGTIVKLPEKESEEYFYSRPAGSQIGAWSSPQSQKIENREVLEQNEETYREQYKDVKIPKPEHWGGYAVTPDLIEFWQGRPNRLHDRILFELINGVWQISRLAP